MTVESSEPPGAELLLEALLDTTSDYIMVADAEGRPVAFNRAYAQIMREALGIEMRPGLKPHSLLPDPAGVAFWDDLHHRALGGEAFTIELAQAFPSGDERHFSFSFNPIRRDGEVTGFCEISREITDRVRAEAALRESERTLRESQAVARIGSYRLDMLSGRWTSSAILDVLFGIDVDFERSVEGWSQIVHPEERGEMERYFAQEVLGRRMPFDREYRIVRVDDGAERWVHGRGQLLFAQNGTTIGMLGTIRDVTERKEMEQRIRQQEKLEAVGRLAGGIAHDFNNQLVAILGFADLLRSKISHEPELVGYADNIIAGARRSADLTNQLLAFSRKGMYRRVPVDLHQILLEVVGVLQRTIDKRIRIVQHLEAHTAVTLGDPTQLQSAVLNLALNACDAMPDGGELVFRTQIARLDTGMCARMPMRVEPGTYVEVSVSDTGAGIDPLLLQRIFEPFFTTKEQGKGTGMGLAAVYGTAKNHEGSVSVTNERGSGAIFRLHLPLSTHQVPTESSSRLPTPIDRDSIHVLLVDDETSVREATVAMLEAIGFRVSTCTNGAEAVALYLERWREFEVVLLDMVMPRLGGREAFFEMKKINPEIRALLASGYSLDAEARELMAQGVRGILQKPFRIGQLSDKVLAALEPC